MVSHLRLLDVLNFFLLVEYFAAEFLASKRIPLIQLVVIVVSV